MQPTLKARDLSLDLLKATAIFLVVFFHNMQLNPDSIADNLFMMIGNAAVPCFFTASGAVFFHRPLSMKKQIRRILQVYGVMVIWRSIYLLLYLQWGAPWNGSLRSLCSYLFFFQSMDGIGTAHFWFMDALLAVMLAAPLLYLCYHGTADYLPPSRLLPGHSTLLVFIMGILLLFNQGPAVGNLLLSGFSRLIGKPAPDISALAEINPFSFRYSNYMTYYLLGALLTEYKKQISGKTAAIFTGGGILGLMLIKYCQTGSFCWNNIHLSGGYYWLSTMCLTAGLFLLFTRIPVQRWPVTSWIARVVGASTLGIFYLHIPLIYVLTPRFTQIAAWNSWLLNTAESFLIILLALIIIWIGRKIPLIRTLF